MYLPQLAWRKEYQCFHRGFIQGNKTKFAVKIQGLVVMLKQLAKS